MGLSSLSFARVARDVTPATKGTSKPGVVSGSVDRLLCDARSMMPFPGSSTNSGEWSTKFCVAAASWGASLGVAQRRLLRNACVSTFARAMLIAHTAQQPLPRGVLLAPVGGRGRRRPRGHGIPSRGRRRRRVCQRGPGGQARQHHAGAALLPSKCARARTRSGGVCTICALPVSHVRSVGYSSGRDEARGNFQDRACRAVFRHGRADGKPPGAESGPKLTEVGPLRPNSICKIRPKFDQAWVKVGRLRPSRPRFRRFAKFSQCSTTFRAISTEKGDQISVQFHRIATPPRFGPGWGSFGRLGLDSFRHWPIFSRHGQIWLSRRQLGAISADSCRRTDFSECLSTNLGCPSACRGIALSELI